MTDHIVVLPGGGYGNLAAHEGEPVAEWIRTLGIEASVLHYPVRRRQEDGPLLTAPREAVAAEVRRVRDAGATRVGILGFSAGGHLAGHAALDPIDPSAAVDLAILCYPVVSFVLPTHTGSMRNLLGEDPSEDERAAASLERLVTPTSPPMFLWHTAEDDAVPVGPVYRLAEALADADVPHAVHVYPLGRHGLGLAGGEGLAERWSAEVAAWLRDLAWGGA